MTVALTLSTRPAESAPVALRRSADRKVTNAVSPNGKTAALANSFGLPAGVDFSCPGATTVCAAVCYAGKLEKIYSGVRAILTQNLAALLAARTVDGMAALLTDMVDGFREDCEKEEKKRAKKGNTAPVKRVFRIHWDGDFFSHDYAEAWARVIAAAPDIRFWVYTRSFHTEGTAIDVLPLLAGLPNLTLYLSVDSANVRQAALARTRHSWVLWAYLADTFADGREDLADLPGKRFPCPENGGRIALIEKKGSACVRCGICVDGRGDVLFSVKKR